MQNSNYYQATGNFSPIAFLYFFLLNLLLVPLLSLAYAYAIWYMPFIYFSIIICAAYGFIVGFAFRFLVLRLGKIRNTGLAIILGVITGIIALYFQWAVWVDLAFNVTDSIGNDRIGISISNIKILEVFQLALHPELLVKLILEINPQGTWGVRGMTVSGIALWIVWLIESLIIVGLTIYASYSQAGEPFCEKNNEWFADHTLPEFNFIEDENTLRNKLEMGNIDAFDGLTLVTDANTQSHSVFQLYESNEDTCYLSITNKVAKTNKKNEIEFDETTFIQYVFLKKDLKEKLNDIVKR